MESSQGVPPGDRGAPLAFVRQADDPGVTGPRRTGKSWERRDRRGPWYRFCGDRSGTGGKKKRAGKAVSSAVHRGRVPDIDALRVNCTILCVNSFESFYRSNGGRAWPSCTSRQFPQKPIASHAFPRQYLIHGNDGQTDTGQVGGRAADRPPGLRQEKTAGFIQAPDLPRRQNPARGRADIPPGGARSRTSR
jgi:hypothetical protein